MPATRPSNLSLVAHVQSQHGEYVKPAQWLISHSWSYKFLDVVDAIDTFCQEHDLGPDTSFWFCMFANNQHVISSADPTAMFGHWLQAFREALTDTGKLVMVLSPWHDPETLKRTWCVYEVYLSVVLKARFEVAMGKAQHAVFLADMQNFESVLGMLAKVNAKNSTTTVATDRTCLFELIEKDQVGFAGVDRVVFGAIQKWIVQALDNQLAMATLPEDRFRWLNSKGNMFVCVGWDAVVRLGLVKAYLREPREAWDPLLHEGLAKLEQILGRTHNTTLEAMKGIGRVYCRETDFDRGMSLLRECLALELQVESNDNVYGTMQYLGEALMHQHNIVEARALLQRAYDWMCRTHGPNFARTLSIQCVLAVGYHLQGRYRDAEFLLQSYYDNAVRVFGSAHGVPTRCLMYIAVIQRLSGEYDKAEGNIRECEVNSRRDDEFEEGYLFCNKELGLVAYSRGNLDQATSILEATHESFGLYFGVDHDQTQEVLLVSYLAHLERGFESEETIDRWLAKFQAAKATAISWGDEHKCLACVRPIQDDMLMCPECPRLSRRLCRPCAVANPPPLEGCDHDITSWTEFKPPVQHLLEQKQQLGMHAATTSDDDALECNPQPIDTTLNNAP
ncbi:hypothetical protein DYB25_003616 [Aphanomyces astaci]|uniref:MalT-like TPR region domain-containing protein n=1 Tax=Aphanomyces astaci TaxID=112090 RepID=A0A397B567_APHAT|nr:hypothetical protein DYB25_003616 [Aphanomyces astaci]